MRNSFFILFLSIFVQLNVAAENLQIEAKSISLDKANESSIFENDVIIKTTNGETLKSNYAEYNKKLNLITLKNNVSLVDNKNNRISAEIAIYNEKLKTFESKGLTEIITTDNYKIESKNIVLEISKKNLSSNNKTIITDNDFNKIVLENFKYNTNSNIFKSIGLIEIKDKLNNEYKFSQIYIDTKKKEILGTDIKAYLNHKDFKINKNNKPRVFSNTIKLSREKSQFNKSVFTLCNYRKKDKCPPWTLQAKEMLHDKEKKTVFYESALIKIYNLPIFYFPYLAHPDPSVERRSGFLPPTLTDTKNLGAGINIPYFYAIGQDRDFTFTNKLYATENPLFLGEYRQAFSNSNLILDFGYTEGYKKLSATKKSGEKSHLFSKFTKNFVGKNMSSNFLSIQTQDTSNDKYLKLYKVKSDLVDFNENILENSIDFTHENENLFFGINASIFETLNQDYNDKYEYILPELTFDKNLFNDPRYGIMDLQSNFKIHNYDTNKTTKFFINDLDWDINNYNFNFGARGKFFGKIKNVNYDVKNVSEFKDDTTSEFFGAFGYLTEIDFYKKDKSQSEHSLSPKILLRYAPGHMRKETTGSRLDPRKVFELDRLDNINNFENGLSATIGFDYEIENIDPNKNFKLSVGQIINEKEKKDMASVTSLDEKLSDLAGSSKLKVNKNLELNYNFLLDENFSDLNYNELGVKFGSDAFKFDVAYLQEKKHVGNQEYFKAKMDIGRNEKGLFSFGTKRNLITNSAEYYDLSYEYINDCLRAGIVYRREFYTDSELEPENSLMFKITLVPFGNINSPSLSQ